MGKVTPAFKDSQPFLSKIVAFQLVQEPLLQGISALTNLAGKLVKDVTDGKTPNTWDVLNHVMDSVTMLGNTNWKLNMK